MFKRFAAYLTSGFLPPIYCATGFALLGHVMPLATLLSGACLALFCLVAGARRAALVAGVSFILLAAVLTAARFLTGASVGPHTAALFAFMHWLPVVILAAGLRRLSSLSLTMQGMLVFGVATVLAAGLLAPDRAIYWRQFFDAMTHDSLAEVVSPAAREQFERLLEVATGIALASLILMWTAMLLLARWMQSLLAQPGGFRAEFTMIELGKAAALATLGLYAATAIFDELTLVNELLIVAVSVFLFQGVATLHYLLAAAAAPTFLFVMLYIALVMSLIWPQLPMLIGLFGALENLINLRRKVGANRRLE